MIADILLLVIGFIWLIAATIQDIRKREVANWISFSLISITLAIRAVHSVVYNDFFYFLYGLAGFAIFFGIANLLYYGRIFAGGDAKLLMGLGVIFATKPYFVQTISMFKIPYAIIFILNILVAGSAYGIVYSIALAFRNGKKLKTEIKRTMKKTKVLRFALVFAALILLIIATSTKERTLYILTMITVVFPYLYVFVKSVESSAMIYPVDSKNLVEGDWLAKPVRIGKKIIFPKWEGLNKQEIILLRKKKKEVLIKQGIPFIPVFLIAAIASLYGNLLENLINIIR